ncbi:hypothetical protein PR202_ga00572 [Eleusine coracana subsp. coracana]|uniref:HD domain-containing protein n=1 Tax=Eleusine coracana subsp. coracana TaxID=191504 RepID=A0AAV5BF35_ELECO|nr:hypothetical protein PR202_ga00572 [Eleusine coracana subsp. coracana]
MSDRDASHAAAHALRVRDLALSLAAEEGLSAPDRLLTVELAAALLHDIGDYKYTKDNVEDTSVVDTFLDELGLEEGKKGEIVSIIKGMGFKNEVSKKLITEHTLEFAIVQDADRLDAIGAIGLNESIKNQFWEDLDSMVSGIPISEKLFIGGDLNGHVGTSNVGFERVHGGFGYGSRNQEGVDILNWALAYDLREDRRACLDCRVIPGECVVTQHKLVMADFSFSGIARCFTFGGSKNNALHDPKILPRDNLSKEIYMSKGEKQTSINHFHEKLFKLKDMMKTESGKRRAEKRHKFMEDFVAEFYEEWSGRA